MNSPVLPALFFRLMSEIGITQIYGWPLRMATPAGTLTIEARE